MKLVIPAQARIQLLRVLEKSWIPAFAGMTSPAMKLVIPAQAGIQLSNASEKSWIPAITG